MKNKISQVSVEYLLIFGIFFIFLIIIISYFVQTVPEEIRLKQATDSIGKITKTIETVYSVGPGTKRIIYVNIPKGTQYINLTPFQNNIGGEISLGLNYKGKLIDLIATINANIIEKDIVPIKTLYKLFIETTEDWKVNITLQ
jgi:uncharacterized protein (UPF0333 family)